VKKLMFLFIGMLFLYGCALSTIKPYDKGKAVPQKAPEPPKKSIIQSIIKPAPAPAPAEKAVVEEETKEEIFDEEEDIK
jgi:hypothetical protein